MTPSMNTTGPIVIAYDGSDDAAAVIERAGDLVAPGPAVVVNVWRSISEHARGGLVALPREVVKRGSEQLDRAAAEESEEIAEKGAELARGAGFKPEPVSIRAARSAPSEVLRVAHDRDARLVALGSRGLSAVGSALLGSVSSTVSQRSSRPVLIAGRAGAGTETGGPILLCYDGSAGARAALEGAGSLVAPRSTIVVTVWESDFSFALRHRLGEVTGVAEDIAPEIEASSTERARATAEEGARVVAAAGLEAEPTAIRAISKSLERDHATVWRAIVGTAEERRAAAIVVGSRGLSGVRSALLGSVSNGVLQHAERPVLLIPAVSEAAEEDRQPV